MTAALRQLQPDRRIRVVIADHSAIVRGMVRRWIEAEPRIDAATVCIDSAETVACAQALRPDVIVLDAGMPGMDTPAVLAQLHRAAPDAHVVMASTLSPTCAAVTVKALTLGAADYIAKPDAQQPAGVESYRSELIAKIVALSGQGDATAQDIRLRSPSAQVAGPMSALVVAASTGGCEALLSFLAPIARRIEAPILVVLPLTAAMTPILAEKLSVTLGRRCREAAEGDVLAPGAMLLAPGASRMCVARCPAGRMVHLDRCSSPGSPVDALFESAAAAFGSRLLGVALSGMGTDGRAGAGRIVAAGGRVIVQDEASSASWEMPGAIAKAGYAEAAKPLKDLSQLTLRLMNGELS